MSLEGGREGEEGRGGEGRGGEGREGGRERGREGGREEGGEGRITNIAVEAGVHTSYVHSSIKAL